MKKHLLLFVLTALCSCRLGAQVGSPDLSPGLSEAMDKVFGTNLFFSASVHTEVAMMPQNQTVTMSGKAYFAGGNSRMEMDMTQMTGTSIPPEAIAQMKSMGMDKMISISQTGSKTLYVIYPGLKAYAKLPQANGSGSTNATKLDSVLEGNETLDNHPCVKKQYTITDPASGQQISMLTWTATDLKDVPVQVQQTMQGKDSGTSNSMKMHFTDISLAKPDPSLFAPPTGYTPYSDVQTMMQTELMKKMGGALGSPQ